jgi:uncharacterized protein (TIGR02246 family)
MDVSVFDIDGDRVIGAAASIARRTAARCSASGSSLVGHRRRTCGRHRLNRLNRLNRLDGSTVDDSERLADVEEIKQLKARYFRCMDTKDWEGFRAVFAPDVTVDISADGMGVIAGVDNFLEFLEPILREVVTVHHGHMPEIEITSPTTATGIWAMEDHLQFGPEETLQELHGYGHYHETYVKLDGRWHIQSTKLTRLRLDVT